MTDAYLDLTFKLLRRRGVELATGLSDSEIDQIETRYGFRFPPDLRRFLQRALPVSKDWVNWREAPEEEIRERLAWPADGICFDIEYNAFWRDDWGARPADLPAAFQIARAQIAQAPKLIPIYSHRYLPDDPCAEGNPVFSVVQTDIIVYGDDLPAYFLAERNVKNLNTKRLLRMLPYRAIQSQRSIRFWSDFV